LIFEGVSKIRDAGKILKLIESGYECEYLDFKKTQYKRENYSDLLIDVMSMANSDFNGDKYILLGIKDKPNGTREIVGIEPTEFEDDATYQNLVFDNIEPAIKFEYYSIEVEQKLIGVLRLHSTNTDRPYMLRKKYANLNEGLCKIRRGSSNSFVTRKDIDKFFSGREKFEIQFMDDCLAAIYDDLGYASITVAIRNYSRLPVVLDYGILSVLNSHEEELSKHRVYGFDKKRMGSDFQLTLIPMSEKLGDLLVGFTSTDCIRLGVDEYGYTKDKLKFKLVLVDTNGNEYYACLDDGSILAKGKFLWKVEMAAKGKMQDIL
jgi:hypothetical protein